MWPGKVREVMQLKRKLELHRIKVALPTFIEFGQLAAHQHSLLGSD
jgi:hypothetical protein